MPRKVIRWECRDGFLARSEALGIQHEEMLGTIETAADNTEDVRIVTNRKPQKFRVEPSPKGETHG